MSHCLFVSDLHGAPRRYERLFHAVETETPAAVFLGGDLLPGLGASSGPDGVAAEDFIETVLAAGFERARRRLGESAPRVFLIPGNDDARIHEPAFLELAERGVWDYIHDRRAEFAGHDVFGYACVPPTPFRLKDWERYDVSRFVDPGCVSPEEGARSVPVPPEVARHGTIQADLDALTGGRDLTRAVFLFHTPPYRTCLDRAALDGKSVDHAPLDVHVGSIAVRRFIEQRQPLLTLHGHVHESSRLTGAWRERIGKTWILGAAHDGPELAVVRFDPERPAEAARALLS